MYKYIHTSIHPSSIYHISKFVYVGASTRTIYKSIHHISKFVHIGATPVFDHLLHAVLQKVSVNNISYKVRLPTARVQCCNVFLFLFLFFSFSASSSRYARSSEVPTHGQTHPDTKAEGISARTGTVRPHVPPFSLREWVSGLRKCSELSIAMGLLNGSAANVILLIRMYAAIGIIEL